MADSDHTEKFNYANLTAIGGRLSQRADGVVMVGAQDIASDLRLAARMASRFATLIFRIGEIAEMALTIPAWDGAAFARDLRDALSDAES
jgi:hypothetical protein